ncbi:MAG TPA: hypothetical protein VF950_08375 [Planctomycetota bacterium]
MSWFPLFLNLFALGTAGSIVAVPYKDIGKYYFKFHVLVALLMVALAVALGQPWKGLGAGPFLARTAAAASLLFALLVLVEYAVVRAAGTELRRDALLLPVSTGAVAVALAAFSGAGHGTANAALLAAHLLTCAAVLGTALVAMSTGHWYLANAKLSFDILVRLCRLFVAAVAAKAVVSIVYLAVHFARYRGLEEFDQLVIGVRLIAGLGFGLALALMSLACAKRRANQSATGILYVGVVFVLIGETISMFLTLGQGRPV